jgi:twitching motility protein PilJ
MANNITEVSNRADSSSEVAQRALSASLTGQQAVQASLQGMNGIRDQIQDTAKRIKRLGESSQQISEIVDLIGDITEQTNVLALNASIQAASAGEAGRGFTVVAEEVQRLAERSGEATKQIAALVRTIQTDTQDAVSAMERSTQGVVEGAKLADAAGVAITDISKVSQELAEIILDIARTTRGQADQAQTVALAIKQILSITERTSAGTRESSQSTEELAALALELKKSVSRFKVSA